MEFRHGELRYEIKEQYGNLGRFAQELGVPQSRLSQLLNGKSRWTDKLIFQAANKLGIHDDIWRYFFTPKTYKSENL